MKPQEIHNQRILISPLNWGMGHVSRCIGLIHQLLNQSNTVIIACNADQQHVFECYFNDLEFVEHGGYPFKFAGKGNFSSDLLKRFRQLNNRKRKELNEAENLCKRLRIDVIISDHRYGFRANNVKSIFVTHQLRLPVKWYEMMIQRLHKKLIKLFDEVWVMDYPDSRLAGKLSQNDGLHSVEYIGPYSRFQLYPSCKDKEYDAAIIVSGPHVYGQQLINKLDLNKYKRKGVVLASGKIKVPEGIEKISDSWTAQDAAILRAERLVSRSGYSTIMDLEVLRIPAELIPTPGQSEQEYLCQLHSKRFKKDC